jgi:hypothetical protein
LGRDLASKEVVRLSQERYPYLSKLSEFPFPVYLSAGTEHRARAIARRCERAYHFLSTTLRFEAEVCILVLAPEHWEDCTGSPMYGVPQTTDRRTLVVAGQNSELWRMIVPPMESLQPPAAQSLRAIYGQSDGSIDIAPYMDLLPVHEIGHLFLDQATCLFDFHLPRRWLVELFCNLGLHAYVAAEEPMQMPNLETFPQTIIAGDSAHLLHQTLDDFERLYADMRPQNFVWYLSQLHIAAKRVYHAGGLESLQSLYQAIAQSQDKLSDEQLALHLRAEVHPEVERVMITWPD